MLRDLCDTMKHGSLCALGGFTPCRVLSALDHFPENFGVGSAAERGGVERVAWTGEIDLGTRPAVAADGQALVTIIIGG